MFSNPWKSFSAFQPKGVLVRGDKTVAPTRWWNHLWLLLFGWSKVAVMRVEVMPSEGWMIGYRDFTGKQMLRMKLIPFGTVRMLTGREDCTFFAVDKFLKEVPLECRSIQEKKEPSEAPLL